MKIKKLLTALAVALIVCLALTVVSACKTVGKKADGSSSSADQSYGSGEEQGDNTQTAMEDIYHSYVRFATEKGEEPLSYEQWLESIRGEDGVTPTVEIDEDGYWVINGVMTGYKAVGEKGEDGLSAYEIYLKYHPEYTGTEEEWVNRFFSGENDLDIFVRQMNVDSYTAELKEYDDGVLASEQVFAKSGDDRYWKKVYNEKDEETGDYYPYPLECRYVTDDNDATYPDYMLLLNRRENVWYGTDSGAQIFISLNQCDMRYYGYEIDPSQFVMVTSTHFKAKQDLVNAAGKAFFYDMDAEHWGELNGVVSRVMMRETFRSLELEIVSGNLKARAESTIVDGDNITDVVYEIVLSKMGVTSLVTPEYKETPEFGFPADTIEDCYEKSQGDEVVGLSCYVTGYIPFVDDYIVWVTDYSQKRGMMVVFEGIGFPYGVQVGRNIVVYGKMDFSLGTRCVLVTRRVDYELQGSIVIENKGIKNVTSITDKDANTVVDLEGVTFDKVALTDKGSVFLTDRCGNEFELWISKREVDLFNEMCKGIGSGEDVDLKNVAIASDESGLYARLTKQSRIELEYGLLLGYTSKTLKESLSLYDALADLTVRYRGDDGSCLTLDKTDYTIVCEDYDAATSGEYEVTVSYGEETATIVLSLYLPEVIKNVSYLTLEETAEENLYDVEPSLPSLGNVNILVIPIGFNNTDYAGYGNEAAIKARLETAFNDTTGRTGWYSLKEYYLKASYGKLNLTANILDIYQTGEDYDLYSGETGVDDWAYIMDALEYYDDDIDYSEYDQNGDWCIDCIYAVYLAPISDDSDYNQSDMWWAYYSYSVDYDCFDDTFAYGYLWMSYEFFDLPIDAVYKADYSIDEERSLYVDINCEAVIHETGHALGLDDYYDYMDGGVKGGVGYFAMMDGNQGDHDPYSKAILGWTNPTVVVNMDHETTLRSFEVTGDTVILSKNNGGTYFEEYFMIAFYTPTGVNQLKSDRECGLPSVSGVMVWHIDATLRPRSELWLLDNVMDMTMYNNGNGKYKLIDLVCADGSTDIDKFVDYVVQDKDIYAAGSVVSGLKWNDGTDLGVEITIGSFVDEDGVEQTTISIDYK